MLLVVQPKADPLIPAENLSELPESPLLKLNVVAEGVETEEQATVLRSLGCDQMQGYLFCKPIPERIFARQFLRSRPSEVEAIYHCPAKAVLAGRTD